MVFSDLEENSGTVILYSSKKCWITNVLKNIITALCGNMKLLTINKKINIEDLGYE